jgi:O-antigen ligase
VVVAALAALAAALPPIAAASVALAVGIAVWRWPEAALELTVVAVLAVRPSLDVFSSRRLGLSEFALNPAVVFGLVVLWIGAVLALTRARAGRPLWPSRSLRRAHWWLCAAYGIAFVSGARLYGAIGVATGVRELIRVASIVAAFLIVLWWVEVDPRRYARGWVYLVMGTMVPVATALSQWATGTGDRYAVGLNRLQGTFSHPSSLGPYLVPFILFAVGGLGHSRGALQLARAAWAAGLTWLVAQTFSRTALLVLVSGLAVLPFLNARRFGWAGLVRGLVVVVVVAGLGWWVAGDVIARRFADISLGPALEAARYGGAENSLIWRLINWAGLLRLGLDHPYTGHGAGMTTVLNPLVDQNTGIPFNAHDDFVRFFFEAGGLGLGCYLIYGALLCAWIVARARTGSPERAAGAYAVAAAWIALFFLTAGTAELSLQTAVQYELYGMAGLLNAAEAAAVPLAEPRTPRSRGSRGAGRLG